MHLVVLGCGYGWPMLGFGLLWVFQWWWVLMYGGFIVGFWVYGQWWVSMWVGFAVVVMGSNGVVGLL